LGSILFPILEAEEFSTSSKVAFMDPSSMLSDWVSFLAYPNLYGIKGFVVVEDHIRKAYNSQHTHHPYRYKDSYFPWSPYFVINN
jgi:hypothetical protein